MIVWLFNNPPSTFNVIQCNVYKIKRKNERHNSPNLKSYVLVGTKS